MRAAGLLNHPLALIIPYTTFNLPFSIIVLATAKAYPRSSVRGGASILYMRIVRSWHTSAMEFQKGVLKLCCTAIITTNLTGTALFQPGYGRAVVATLHAEL